MKYLLLLCSLLAMQLVSKAQTGNKTTVSNEMVIAFNAEQMIEKMGFENLMSTFFDKGIFKNGYRGDGNVIAIRKSLAALYGSGIDFKRKFWFSNSQNFYKDLRENHQDLSKVFFMIPVANRAIFQESVLNIVNHNKEDNDKVNFINTNTISYCKSNSSILLLTDKDFIVYKMPYFNDYNSNDYRGVVIKADTIVIPKSERFNYDYNETTAEEVEAVKNKAIIEVDKVMDNGKVVRLLKKEKSIPKVKSLKAKQAPYADEATTVSVDGVKEAYPSAALADTTFTSTEVTTFTDTPQKIDTLSETDYVNDSIRLVVYYIPYTEMQRDSVSKAKEIARTAKEQHYIDQLLKNMDQFKVYDRSDADTKKIKEAKEDVAMISTSAIPNMGGGGSFMGLLLGGGYMSDSAANGASSYLSFVNFENGKAVLKSQTSCCNNNNKFINEMYLPVSNFWPKEAQKNSTGFLHMNINLPLVLNYFTTVMGERKNFDKELKQQGVERADFENAFTGEVVMNMTIGKRESSNKKEPLFFAAIKLKDAKNAVSLMNKLASHNAKMPNNYQFDEKGEYIMLYSKNKMLTKAIQKADSLNLPTGTFGTMRFNIGEIVNAFIYDGERKSDLKRRTYFSTFFGALSIVNNKTEDGNFIGEGFFEMGDKNKNALANLLDFVSTIDQCNAEVRKEEDVRTLKYNEANKKRRATDKKMQRAIIKKATTKKAAKRK